MAESYTTKDITTVGEVNTLETTDKIFVNDSDSLKQISLSNLMDSSGALKKNQGAENSGKSLIVGEDGNVVLGEKPVKVDSTLSQSGQAADAKATGDRISALSIHQTVSGESLQIEDSAGAPMAGLRVFGKSRQVKTTGAQLIPCPIDEELESYDGFVTAISKDSGIEVTLKTGFNPINSNSDIYFAGGHQANEESNYELQPQIPAGQYHLHIDDETFNRFLFYIVVWRNESSNVLSSGITQDIDITIQENDKFRIFIHPKTDATTGTYTIKPMLNSSSTALPWEPYTGGKPSPSPDYPQEIEIPGSEGNVGVNVTGAQLVQLPDMGKTINGVTFTINEDGYVIANGTAASLAVFRIPIPSQPSTGEFYLSGCPKGGSIDTYRLDLRKENNSALIIDNGSGEHGQISEKVSYIGVRIAAGYTANNVVFHPMLNSGSTALPWEPYHTPQKLTVQTPNGLPGIPVYSGGNYTDSDGQQWICDEVDFARGKYVQRVKKVVYDGSEDEGWIVHTTTNDYGIANFRIYIKDSGNNNGLCSHLIAQRTLIAATQTEGFMISESTTLFFRIKQDRAKDITEFRQMLSGDNIAILYILATPIETDLSEEELTAYAALRTNYPTTVVTSDSDPITVGIEVEYVADTQKYIDNKFAELAQNLAATQNTLLEV